MAIIKRNNNRDELDLPALFKYIMKRLWCMFLIGAFLGGAIACSMYKYVPPVYKASSRMYVNNMISTEKMENISYSDLTTSITLTETYLTILDSDLIFNEVVDTAGLNYSKKEMDKIVSFSTVKGTAVLKITATTQNAKKAALIANTYADVGKKQLMDIVEGSSVKILDYADTPKEPESRGIIKFSVLGFLVGVILAAFFILVRALNEKSIRSIKDLEYFGAPCLGHIPDQYKAAGKKPRKKNMDNIDSFVLLNDNTPFAVREAYNSLRTNLVYSFSGKRRKVILVTSTMEHEGKTSTSLNLGKTLSESGYNVLIIDGDLRRGSISRSLKINSSPGLSDYLAGVCNPKEMIQIISDHLSVITAGTVPPNPNSLLSSAEMKKLIDAVNKLYDYVIIDAPPTLPVSDPVILARLCTGYIVIVRNTTPNRDEISACLNKMNVTNVPFLGFVFTCESKPSGHGDYQKYGYYEYK